MSVQEGQKVDPRGKAMWSPKQGPPLLDSASTWNTALPLQPTLLYSLHLLETPPSPCTVPESLVTCLEPFVFPLQLWQGGKFPGGVHVQQEQQQQQQHFPAPALDHGFPLHRNTICFSWTLSS